MIESKNKFTSTRACWCVHTCSHDRCIHVTSTCLAPYNTDGIFVDSRIINIWEGVVMDVHMTLKTYILGTWLSPRDRWSRSNITQLHRSTQVCTRVRGAYREYWNGTHYLTRFVCQSLYATIWETCDACVYAFIASLPSDKKMLIASYIDISLKRHMQTLYLTTWCSWNEHKLWWMSTLKQQRQMIAAPRFFCIEKCKKLWHTCE